MPKINQKFHKMLGKDTQVSLDSANGISARSLKDITLVAERAGKLSGGGGDVAASTVGTICTSECISTASSVCAVDDIGGLAQRDPELMKAVSYLHDRAIRELGEDGLAQAMADMSK